MLYLKCKLDFFEKLDKFYRIKCKNKKQWSINSNKSTSKKKVKNRDLPNI